MNYKMIIHILGWALVLEAVFMVLPMACALIYGEEIWWIYLGCAALSFAAGYVLKNIPVKNKNMYAKEGLVAVSLSWIVISLVGSLPFVLTGSIPNFIDALFETVSGFTTTGATILTDVEILPKSILFWRSFTHWIGGMGVLVFLVSILKLSGSNNIYLLKAESTGPTVGKIVPRVQSSAKILYILYTVLTVVEILLLLVGGMKPFEAITLSLGTAGTGGFAVLNSGLYAYTSYQQVVITIFMLLFGVDFSVYFLIITRKGKEAFRSEEVRAYFGIVLVATILIWIDLCVNMFSEFDGIWDVLKHSAFQVSSIITTTGYTTTNFNIWPEFSKTILVLLMFIGACAGSTGGGIKVCRIMILLKSVIKELKLVVHPKSTHKITMNKRPIEHETIRSINVYMVVYVLIYVVSMLIVSLDGLDFTTNFTAVAATLNNIGPGLGEIHGNFVAYSGFSKLIFIIDMLIGRLEVFPMVILFSPYTWKK